MEFVTVAQARNARRRDGETGRYVDQTAAYRLSAQYVRLFDPPGVAGVVRDGEGNAMTSIIVASDVELALSKGFSEESPEPKRGRKDA